MNKKLKKLILGLGAFALIGYSILYYQNNKYNYTKSSEIISEVIKEKKKSSELEKYVKSYVNNISTSIESGNSVLLRKLFISDCEDLTNKAKKEYFREFDYSNKISYDFMQLDGDELKVFVEVSGEPDILYGKYTDNVQESLESLKLKCNYFGETIAEKLVYNENGDYCVQVASLQNEDNAKELVSKLSNQDYIVYINKKFIKGKDWYAVMVGNFNKKEANNVKNLLKERFNDAFLIKYQ